MEKKFFLFTDMITLQYNINDEIFKFILNHLKDVKINYLINDTTLLYINNQVYTNDQMLEKIIFLFNSNSTISEVKKMLKINYPQKSNDLLLNIINYYNILKNMIEKGSLKNYDFLKTNNCTIIDFEFYLLEIKAGTISEIYPLENMDKIFIEKVNIGNEIKTICSGLRNYYKEIDLKNKTFLFITNLKPTKFGNIFSHGMICCGSNETIVEPISINNNYNGYRISLENTENYFEFVKKAEIPLLKKEKYLNVLKSFKIKNGFLYFKNSKCYINKKEILLHKIQNGNFS